MDSDAEMPDLFCGLVGEGGNEVRGAHAFAGNDAEGFTVNCITPSKDLV